MQPLSSLTADNIRDIRLLSFDVDGVTIERGTQISEKGEVLRVKTKSITPQLTDKLVKLKQHFFINITSGRSLLYLSRMFAPLGLDRVTIQAENGLFTLIDGEILQTDKVTEEELAKTEEIRAKIISLSKADKNISGFEPKQFMITVHANHEDEEIENIVKSIDTKGEFYCFWMSGEAYDIFLKRFNKGTGLEFLTSKLGIKMSQVLDVGNDPNDKSVTDRVGIGVTTSREGLQAGYYTEGKYNLGGEEVVDKLLELIQ